MKGSFRRCPHIKSQLCPHRQHLTLWWPQAQKGEIPALMSISSRCWMEGLRFSTGGRTTGLCAQVRAWKVPATLNALVENVQAHADEKLETPSGQSETVQPPKENQQLLLFFLSSIIPKNRWTWLDSAPWTLIFPWVHWTVTKEETDYGLKHLPSGYKGFIGHT